MIAWACNTRQEPPAGKGLRRHRTHPPSWAAAQVSRAVTRDYADASRARDRRAQRRRCGSEPRRRSPDAAGTGQAAARAGGARPLRPARRHRRQPDAARSSSAPASRWCRCRTAGPSFRFERPRTIADLELTIVGLRSPIRGCRATIRRPFRRSKKSCARRGGRRTSPCTSAASSCSSRGGDSGAPAAAGRKARIARQRPRRRPSSSGGVIGEKLEVFVLGRGVRRSPSSPPHAVTTRARRRRRRPPRTSPLRACNHRRTTRRWTRFGRR